MSRVSHGERAVQHKFRGSGSAAFFPGARHVSRLRKQPARLHFRTTQKLSKLVFISRPLPSLFTKYLLHVRAPRTAQSKALRESAKMPPPYICCFLRRAVEISLSLTQSLARSPLLFNGHLIK